MSKKGTKKPAKHEFSKWNDTFRLLYIEPDGTKVYLQKHSWDCNWYWGMGYLETFTNNKYPEKSDDISSHFHFKNFFDNGYEKFSKLESPLSERDLSKIYFMFHSAYTMREFAELLHLKRTNWSYNSESVLIELPEYFSEEKLNEKLGQFLDEIWAMLA